MIQSDQTAAPQIPVILLGAGNMGGAMVRGWLSAGLLAPGSVVIDPHADEMIRAVCADANVPILDGVPDTSVPVAADACFVIAIKPQMAGTILPDFAELAAGRTVLSVMAGKSLAAIAQALSLSSVGPMARAMPNVGSAVGAGATGLHANAAVDKTGRARITRLMETIGTCVWVEQEAQIDAVTAISGSGPAYFFLLVEALTAAGIEAGLSPVSATTLARATAHGAGRVLHEDLRSAQALRQSVTSPGGTTAAALDIFERDNALRELTRAAVKAAVARAIALNDDAPGDPDPDN